VVKPLTDFSYDRRRRDGRQARCRVCARDRQRAYYLRYPERKQKARRRDYAKNSERYKSVARQWYATNRDRAVKRNKQYRETPRSKERHREASARYTAKNRALTNERIRDWGRRNPTRARDYAAKRRARAHAAGRIERIDVLVLAERDGWTCWLCEQPVDPSLTYPDHGYRSVDHVIPLGRGGAHTYENVRLAHWICNVRRGIARYEETG
jgi:hypothetical protein